MKKQYQFAGVELEVNIPKQWMYSDERMLRPFRTDRVSHPHQFHMEIAEELDAPQGREIAAMPGYRVFNHGGIQQRYIGSVEQGWQNAYIKATHHGKNHSVQLKASECGSTIGVKSVLNAMSAEHLVLEADGVILHASFIEHDGKAILFTAPSGTGKSTQAELWAKHRGAEIINGDRAVIRLIDGKPYACGIPFAGSSTYCKNKTLHLEAIVFLGQAPSTSISRLTGISAFTRIWHECTVNTWNPEDVDKATGIVLDILSKVPVFHLTCTPDESAVTALEDALKNI